MNPPADYTKAPEMKKKPEMDGGLIIKLKADKHYEAGVGAMSQSQFDKAVSCFSKAILLQSHQTQFYVQRAEAYLQLCDFQSAALDYKHAYSLQPQTEAYSQRLAFIYYLQGQCLFDLGKFPEALESFTKATELKPNFQPYHMRRLACLTALGRYSDCLGLVSNWLETDGQSADLLILRARLHHQLSQMTLCYHDVRSALRLKPGCPAANSLLKRLEEAAEHAYQAAVSNALKGELSDALRNVKRALEYNPSKAQYYLCRGILYRRLKDFTAAIEDLVLAAEFCGVEEEPPQEHTQDDSENLEDAQTQLVLTYNDFAIQCFFQGLYNEAIMLLNKAIDKRRDASELFINRGDCFFKLGEWLFALADYQQAEEMDPDNTSIWIRLAVIHNTLGLHSYDDQKYQEAADKFSVAIRYNPGVVQYYENRGKAYNKVAKFVEAKKDAISVLILEPTNDQVVPLLLSLLPGCSLTDIMSCATAQSVKTLLMEKVQAFKKATAKVSRIGRMALTKDNSQSQASSPKLQADDPEQKIKPCVTLVEAHCKLVKRKQLNQAVKRALQQRQSLHYDGPRLAPIHPAREESSTQQRPYVWRKFGGLGLNC